jgi:dCMP deaminase
MKQKFIDAHMAAAEVYAKLSSAKRLQVGCVIVKNNTIIGIGYNGMPSGWTNECEEWVELSPSEKVWSDADRELRTKIEVIHAESNAISKVARSTNSTQDADLFVTHAPCIHCAKLIHQSGIKSVFYRNTYRDECGIEFLNKCNIAVSKV